MLLIIKSRGRNDQDISKASSRNHVETISGEVEAEQVGNVRKSRIPGCADSLGATCKVAVHSEMRKQSSP